MATELFFVFFRREKNKHNGASYLFSFTKEDLVKHIRKRTIQTGRLFFSSSLTCYTRFLRLKKEKITASKNLIYLYLVPKQQNEYVYFSFDPLN